MINLKSAISQPEMPMFPFQLFAVDIGRTFLEMRCVRSTSTIASSQAAAKVVVEDSVRDFSITPAKATRPEPTISPDTKDVKDDKDAKERKGVVVWSETCDETALANCASMLLSAVVTATLVGVRNPELLLQSILLTSVH
jgi:hypothetical protein